MSLAFQDRPSCSSLVSRVWTSRSGADVDQMLSIAHVGWDLVVWRNAQGVFAGLQGPELAAAVVPMPLDTESVGVRFRASVRVSVPGLQPEPGAFVPLPVTEGGFELGGRRWPRLDFEQAENTVDALLDAALLRCLPPVARPGLSTRTRQRRYRDATGVTPTRARQIARAHDAALALRGGRTWASVVEELGYYDQAHLSRSVRRFIGASPSLLTGRRAHLPLSLLYKTAGEDHL